MNRRALLNNARMTGLLLAEPKRPAHKLVASVACAMAAEVYEVVARDDAVYRRFSTVQSFVDATWEQYLPDARNTLVDMLSTPGIPEAQKEEIAEALGEDFAFVQAAERGTINDPTPKGLVH